MLDPSKLDLLQGVFLVPDQVPKEGSFDTAMLVSTLAMIALESTEPSVIRMAMIGLYETEPGRKFLQENPIEP